MAKTEAAKALEAKQKAAIAAEKERKRNSQDPKDWGTLRSIKELYKLVASQDPKFPILFFAALLGPFIAFLVVALILMATIHMAWWNVVLLVLLGLMIGFALAQWLLARRGKNAALSRYEGQAGSGEIALQMLGKDWSHDAVIAFTRQQDVVHRALGPGGLWLVGEGDPGRVRALLAQESKRHEQSMYGLKVKTVVIGDAPNQVPLKELTKFLQKQPKTLGPQQIAETSKRLRALDAVRRKMMVPQGPLPTKVSRSAMRGR